MRAGLLALIVVVVLGAGTALLVASRRGAHEERMRSDLARDVAQGGLAGLTRAQARARRLMLADPSDREAVATLAFANVVLAVEYGLDSAGDVPGLLGRGREPPGTTEAVTGLAAAARALWLLHAGDREGAARQATAAAKAAPGAPHPMYALGRIRARGGDLPGAAHALEGALSREPGFALAEVTWAEVQLDGGDPQAARTALKKTLGRPGCADDPRALLLLSEAERAAGEGAAPVEKAVCDRLLAATATTDQPAPSRWPPAAVRAGCALARAAQARATGHRAEAVAHAEEAGRLAPAEPRLLTRTSLLLAQLGEIDWAAGLLERARRLNPTETPAVRWAAAALDLGRGHALPLPRGMRPADPEIRLTIARGALSAAGLGGLRTALAGLGPGPIRHDADLAMLAALVTPDRGAAPGSGARALSDVVPADDPFRAYLEGVRANLAGDITEGARRLAHALSGHGDACRAAGEYIDALKVLKRPDDPRAFTALRAENSTCVNLR